MIGLSYKQKCNNFGYHSIEVQLKGNDKHKGDKQQFEVKRPRLPFNWWPVEG